MGSSILAKIHGHHFTYIIGAGGERLKPAPYMFRESSLDTFMDQLLKAYSNFSFSQVVQLLNIDGNQLKENILKEIKKFLEKSNNYKYLHLWVYKEGFKYDFQGEDNKRNYFRTTTPFYSHQVFLSAMSFPYKYKTRHKFYLDVMKALNPEILKIRNKDWGIKLSDPTLFFHLFLRDLFNDEFKLKLRRLLRKEEMMPNDKEKDSFFENQKLYNVRKLEDVKKNSLLNSARRLLLLTPSRFFQHLEQYEN